MKNSEDMRLIVAVVHDSDSETILHGLLAEKYSVTRIASTGGLLRRGNTTMLIGVDAERVPGAMKIIRENSAPPVDPGLKRATVFVLKVDRFVQV
ncbi:MAG: cyclic-di-AMP receptor [Chloroflexota bacterium]